MPQFRPPLLLFVLLAFVGVIALPAICAAAPPTAPEVRPALPTVAHLELRASAAPAGAYLYLGACEGAELVGAHVEALPACERIEAARGFAVTLSEDATLRALPSPSGEAVGLRKAGSKIFIQMIVSKGDGDGPRYLWGRLASTHADCGGHPSAISDERPDRPISSSTSDCGGTSVRTGHPCEVQPANRPEGGTGCNTAREVAPHLLCHLRGPRSTC